MILVVCDFLNSSIADDDEILEDDNEECLSDDVDCVRSVERGQHVELRAEETEERADRDFQEGDEVEHSDVQDNLDKYLDWLG